MLPACQQIGLHNALVASEVPLQIVRKPLFQLPQLISQLVPIQRMENFLGVGARQIRFHCAHSSKVVCCCRS